MRDFPSGRRSGAVRRHARQGESQSRALAALVLALPLAGCLGLGPTKLSEDQIGYSRTLTTAQNRSTLLNIVRLRYGDTPTFLDATQIISGYQLQKSVTGGFELLSRLDPSSYINGGGAVQLQESPTFTFQPVAGEQFAQSFIRPLSPDDLLPFTLSGLPVDVMFRLSIRSIAGETNSTALAQNMGEGSAGFFRLTHDLRLLQIAGLLGVRQAPAAPVAAKPGKPAHTTPPAPSGTELTFSHAHDPEMQAVEAETRRFLGLKPNQLSATVVYGLTAAPGQIPLLTRSMLGVLGSIAFDIDVPAEDVAHGATIASMPVNAYENRRPIIVHAGQKAPADAFVSIAFHNHEFWIEDGDFDSKVAFTVLQLLMQLAKTSGSAGAVITIPAG